MKPGEERKETQISDRESDAGADRRSRDTEIALVLPLIGIALFSPPLVGIFASETRVFGAPLIVAYIFIVWIALIFGARWVSRRLSERTDQR